MSDIVKDWMNNFFARNNDMITKSIINSEITEIMGDISNNRLWQKGSNNFETITMYENNITDLNEYLEALKDMLAKF